MSSKVVVSVSMDDDLARDLRAAAKDLGESFSGLVCRMVVAGRYHEGSDPLSILDDQDLEQGDDAGETAAAVTSERAADDAATQGREPVVPRMPPDRPESKSSSAEEELADERRSAPDDVAPTLGVDHETVSAQMLDEYDQQQEDPDPLVEATVRLAPRGQKTVDLRLLDEHESQIYDRVSEEPRSADEIAGGLGWPVGAVKETLEVLRAAGACEYSDVGAFYWRNS